MQKSRIMEDKVKLAMREFASSIKSGRMVVADMSTLVDVTSELPLLSPDYVVEALCVALFNWNSRSRIEEVDKKILLQIICEDEIALSLSSKLISSTSGPMPSLFSQLGRTPILDGNIEEIASFAIQPFHSYCLYTLQTAHIVIWVVHYQVFLIGY